jgi:geranylgeranyl diphosphate synthase, type II
MATSIYPVPVAETLTYDFAADRAAVDEALRQLCDSRLAHAQGPVAEAIRYSILSEGKRLRPVLLLGAYRAAGGERDASALGAAVEVVHAYSLVHDDLPCMDDDDVRRGRPTTHRVFGVTAATAAGVAMVPLAARAAFDAAAQLGLPPRACGDIVRELMQASGASGMVGGQLLDLQGENHQLPLEELERIHLAKTGALIVAAVAIGGMAAEAGADALAALRGYGRAVGLAFQIADDVLDATATTAELGKTAGRDAVLRKSTYPAHLGVEGARARAESLAERACDLLRTVGLLTPALERLAQFSVARRS